MENGEGGVQMSIHKGGKKNKWSTEELDTLERLHSEGLTYSNIAQTMKRSLESVERKIQEYIPGRKRIYSNDLEVIKSVIERRNTGESYVAIAKKLNLDYQMVRRVIRRNGSELEKPVPFTKNPIPPDLVEKVKELYLNQNLSLSETASKLNMSYNRVNGIINLKGLRKKPCDWSDQEFQMFFEMLEAKEPLLKMCHALNKTDAAIKDCAKYFKLYEKYPIVQSRISKEQGRQIVFASAKLASARRYDNKYFHKTDLRLSDIFEIFERQNGKCFYTGRALQFRSNCEDTLSIERIDSDKPHSKDNVVLCTWESNLMKQDMDIERFLITAQEIALRAQAIRDSIKELSRQNQQAVAAHSPPESAPSHKAA